MSISKIARTVASFYKMINYYPRHTIKVWEAYILQEKCSDGGQLAKIVFTIINPTKLPLPIAEAALEYGGDFYKPVEIVDRSSTMFPLSVPAHRYQDCDLMFNIDFSNDPEGELEAKLIFRRELKEIGEKVRFKAR